MISHCSFVVELVAQLNTPSNWLHFCMHCLYIEHKKLAKKNTLSKFIDAEYLIMNKKFFWFSALKNGEHDLVAQPEIVQKGGESDKLKKRCNF